MPWRAGRRWWCGCDGSGVRRRRVRGRRGWRGGVGCGCTSSPTGRWRSRGRRGPSRGRRARRARACRTCPGPRRRRLRRRSPRLRPMPRCPRRRVVRCRRWTGDLDPWSLWWTRPVRHRPSRCLRRRIACSRAPTALSAPRARAGGPADDAAGAYRPRDEGRAAEPRPGRHAGVGSAGGALPAFSRVGFRRPPSEPDVRIPAHPALHPCYAVAFAVQGLGMRVPR